MSKRRDELELYKQEFDAVERGWLRGKLERIEMDGALKGWKLVPPFRPIKYGELPYHFIAHEFDALDDAASLTAETLEKFMAEWGLLFHPMRSILRRGILAPDDAGADAADYLETLDLPWIQKAWDAIGETQNMRVELADVIEPVEPDYKSLEALMMSTGVQKDDILRLMERLKEAFSKPIIVPSPEWSIISIEEAVAAVDWFQDFLESFDQIIKKHKYPEGEFVPVFNSNLVCTRELPSPAELRSRFDPRGSKNLTLTQAICTQVFEIICDETEWRPCPRCDHMFKRKRDENGMKQTKNRNDAKFCSDKCKDPTDSKTYRDNKKAQQRQAGGE